MPVGAYHFRFVEDTGGSENRESLVDRSGSLGLTPRERAGCTAAAGECWHLEGDYSLTPAGYATVRAALRRAGIADSLPATGRAAGGWRDRPGGEFWVILNDGGPGPKVEVRAAPGQKRWTAEGEWCLTRCAGGVAGKVLVVRTKM